MDYGSWKRDGIYISKFLSLGKVSLSFEDVLTYETFC